MNPSPSSESVRHAEIKICGMHCASCELLLERKISAVPGIVSVDVDYKKGTAVLEASATELPDPERIAEIIRKAGYSLAGDEAPTVDSVAPDQRKWMEIGASFLIIFALWKLLQTFDLVALAPSTTGALSLGGVLLIGLVAGASSCLAVTGGLLLAMAAKWNETHQSGSAWDKFKPLLSFNVGRLASYFVFGGLVGLLGQSITLSTKMTGYMNIIVAVVMLSLALKILQILPQGGFPIRPPKSLSRWIARLSESEHPLAPFTLGAMTFFLPCGFTQSLQLVALASGSFATGALTMFTFALGTLPALLGISLISSTATGAFSRLFLRFSGALVLLMALFNLQNGVTLAGFDLQGVLAGGGGVAQEAAAVNADGVQEVRMAVTSYAYEPASLTIKAGVPVRWVVDGSKASGCTSVLAIPDLRISKPLKRGENIIEFTAQKKGRLAFMCSMGMVRGSFNVI